MTVTNFTSQLNKISNVLNKRSNLCLILFIPILDNIIGTSKKQLKAAKQLKDATNSVQSEYMYANDILVIRQQVVKNTYDIIG